LAIKIELTISVADDFHIGTGAGRGRATDAVVLVDERHVPYVPGSAIKGLCKWQACRLIDAYPALGPKPEPPATGPAFEIFGGGTDLKHAENRVWFDHAYPGSTQTLSTVRTGRSARDRVSGRARDQHLFFYEDASAAQFSTVLTCEDDLSPAALLLLVLALRRIEALGGQRRRGKGRCRCTVRVIDPGAVAELAGLVLPSSDAAQSDRFCSFAQAILGRPPTLPTDDSPTDSESSGAVTETSTAANPSVASQVCWLVFGYAESPLTLGHDQALDNTIPSEDFVSGASLRGALAWQAVRSGISPNTAWFRDTFVREQVHFGPLYPAVPGWGSRTLPLPMPASFSTCKRFPGTYGPDADAVHGVLDRFHGARENCVSCDAALKPADGYCQLDGDVDLVHPVLGRPAVCVFQRTAIDEATQRGKDGALYALESIQRGTCLAGYVWGPRHLLERLFETRRECWTTVRVGKAKSRGQGVLQIFAQPADDEDHPVFPRLLPASWPRPAPDPGSPASSDPFCVTLYSDLIAVDNWLRPVTQLTAESLWRLLGGDKSPPFELDRGFAGVRRIGGFIGVAGLPRSTDLALTAGSTWRFRWRAADDEPRIPDAWDRLVKAQGDGLGLRRGEGFGRFIVNLPLQHAGWNEMTLQSLPIPCSLTDFPLRDAGQTARAKRVLGLPGRRESQDKKADSDYRRLFAELARQANPVRAVQDLLDDPLHRHGKIKNLPEALKELGFLVKHPPDPNRPEDVERFRDSLKTASGETA
jgi:hypothetical protein